MLGPWMRFFITYDPSTAIAKRRKGLAGDCRHEPAGLGSGAAESRQQGLQRSKAARLESSISDVRKMHARRIRPDRGDYVSLSPGAHGCLDSETLCASSIVSLLKGAIRANVRIRRPRHLRTCYESVAKPAQEPIGLD
jgi:hypothetical protein